MKIDQLLNEHKKGVKAVKYAKKPQPVVGPEALKKQAKAKTTPPKTELEKHSKLSAKLENVSETAKLSTREKFKRSLKRAGYDPDAGAKRIEDLLAKQKKEREEREKANPEIYGTTEKDMKEAKQPEAPKPRNFVAKNAKTAGAGAHKDAKKASKEVRGQKHKNKEMAETYDQARAARIRYALMIKEGDWDQQSDEMVPPEYEMNPEELKAIRNAEFSDEDKIQAMIKLSAGGTSDEEIAKIFDMDKETVAGILDDYIEDIEATMEPEDDVKEAEMGKVIDYKPGQTATIDTGPGMTTVLDLKKNPTSLTKNPDTGKLQLVSTPKTTAQPSATTQSTVKPGDAVEIGKTTEDLLRLAGLK